MFTLNETKGSKISIVIPSLNEESGIEETLRSIPRKDLQTMGYEVEVLVVDGGSIDRTREIAEKLNTIVILEPRRGYGIPLRTGFKKATGDIIVTADADHTYPLENVPDLIRILDKEGLEFVTTNRFSTQNEMSFRNRFGNALIALMMRILFNLKLTDSQSGMWVLRKSTLEKLVLKSNIPFSQEIKIEACHFTKCKWKEVPIRYKTRRGRAKFGNWRVGLMLISSLFWKRLLRGEVKNKSAERFAQSFVTIISRNTGR